MLSATSREDTESQRAESFRIPPNDSGELQKRPAAPGLTGIPAKPVGRLSDGDPTDGLTGDQDATSLALEHLAEVHAADALGRGDA